MSYTTIITSDPTTRILNNNFLMFSNHMDFKRAANNLAQDKERSQNFGETSWEKSRLTLKCCDDSLRRRLRKCSRCSRPKGLRWTKGFVPFSKGHRPNLFRGMDCSDLGFSRFFPAPPSKFWDSIPIRPRLFPYKSFQCIFNQSFLFSTCKLYITGEKPFRHKRQIIKCLLATS